jgi:hypothetical protein
MDNPADLINVAVEQLRLQQCELPTFPALDRKLSAAISEEDGLGAAFGGSSDMGQNGYSVPCGGCFGL